MKSRRPLTADCQRAPRHLLVSCIYFFVSRLACAPLEQDLKGRLVWPSRAVAGNTVSQKCRALESQPGTATDSCPRKQKVSATLTPGKGVVFSVMQGAVFPFNELQQLVVSGETLVLTSSHAVKLIDGNVIPTIGAGVDKLWERDHPVVYPFSLPPFPPRFSSYLYTASA